MTHGPAQDPNSLMLITLLVSAGAAIFWRAVIKLLAIGAILVVVLGFFELLGKLHLYAGWLKAGRDTALALHLRGPGCASAHRLDPDVGQPMATSVTTLRSPSSAQPEAVTTPTRLQAITAGRRAFSPTAPVT
jgi:hypothetical protein